MTCGYVLACLLWCRSMFMPRPSGGVYICESIQTARLHGNDHRPSPKMQRVYSRFRTCIMGVPNARGGGGSRDGVCERKSPDELMPSFPTSGDRNSSVTGGNPGMKKKERKVDRSFPGMTIEAPSSSSSSASERSNHEIFHHQEDSENTTSGISPDVLQWLSNISSMSPISHHVDEDDCNWPSSDQSRFRRTSFASSLGSDSFTEVSYPTPSKSTAHSLPNMMPMASHHAGGASTGIFVHENESSASGSSKDTTTTPKSRKSFSEVLKGSGDSGTTSRAHHSQTRGPPAVASHPSHRTHEAAPSSAPSQDENWWQQKSRVSSFSDDTISTSDGGSVIRVAGHQPDPKVPQGRKTVHWPHSSFRYMFLSEDMKQFIHNTIADIQKKQGGPVVNVTCPFRDKKDASVCMLLEGPVQAVNEASAMFNEMLRGIMRTLKSEKVLLSSKQFEELTCLELSRVKAIQGSSGVHVV